MYLHLFSLKKECFCERKNIIFVSLYVRIENKAWLMVFCMLGESDPAFCLFYFSFMDQFFFFFFIFLPFLGVLFMILSLFVFMF
jgi:hypothetical protein